MNNVKLERGDLSLSFGAVEALANMNLEARERKLVAVIRPDGASKAVLLTCINAFYHPQRGIIH